MEGKGRKIKMEKRRNKKEERENNEGEGKINEDREEGKEQETHQLFTLKNK